MSGSTETKDLAEVEKLRILEFAESLRKLKAPKCKTGYLKFYVKGIEVSLNDLADIIHKEVGSL